MFGYQNLANWGFHYLEPRSYHYDYQAMMQFLGPNGSLFKLIDRLLTDQDAVFQLPFEILPVCVHSFLLLFVYLGTSIH